MSSFINSRSSRPRGGVLCAFCGVNGDFRPIHLKRPRHSKRIRGETEQQNLRKKYQNPAWQNHANNLPRLRNKCQIFLRFHNFLIFYLRQVKCWGFPHQHAWSPFARTIGSSAEWCTQGTWPTIGLAKSGRIVSILSYLVRYFDKSQ